MDKDLRASLVAAGSAAALSALIGIIAGVGFFTLLFRAIVGALLIGGAVYGGIILLRTMVPGLFSPAAATEAEADDFDPLRSDATEKGGNVDIVLPGEPLGSESFLGPDEAQAYAPGGRSRAAIPGLASGRGSAESVLDEEAAELSPVDDTSLLEAEGSEGERAAAMPSSAVPDKGRRPSSGFDDLDVLPDLEGFSDSFTASEFTSGGSSAASSEPASYGGGAGSSSGSRRGQGQDGLDPAALAQAVRTILKRDQKG